MEKVNSKDAFQWQSMLKCYWKEDAWGYGGWGFRQGLRFRL